MHYFLLISYRLIVGDRHVGLQIWDTAGQERFHCLAVSFYRGADACLLVFDVTDRESFDHLSKWKQDMLTHTNAIDNSKFPFVVLGTKIDLGDEQRRVSHDEAEAFARGLGVSYYEVSALSGENVDAAFLEIAIKAKEAADQVEMVLHSERINDDAVVDLEGESDEDDEGKKGCC